MERLAAAGHIPEEMRIEGSHVGMTAFALAFLFATHATLPPRRNNCDGSQAAIADIIPVPGHLRATNLVVRIDKMVSRHDGATVGWLYVMDSGARLLEPRAAFPGADAKAVGLRPPFQGVIHLVSQKIRWQAVTEMKCKP